MNMNVKVAGKAFPAWIIMLVAVSAGSMLAADTLTTPTVKTGQVGIVVGQHLAILNISNIRGSEPAKSTASYTISSDRQSFSATFISDPGDTVSMDLAVANYAATGTVVYVSISQVSLSGTYPTHSPISFLVSGSYARLITPLEYAIWLPPSTSALPGVGVFTIGMTVSSQISAGGTFLFNVNLAPATS